MRVIINADDLGASESVNDAIFEMMSRKYVTSATLLANGPCLTQAIKALTHFPNNSFGIHLNITEFKPLTSGRGLTEILDKDVSFRDNIFETKKTPLLLLSILKELNAQIEKLLSLGVKVSHIDSHYHIHTIPEIFPVLKYIQKKYKIRKVRIPLNIYRLEENISKYLILQKNIYNFALRNFYKTKTTSGFTYLSAFYENAKLNNLQHETVEIMVHPGRIEEERENELLSTPWKEDLSVPIYLINYNQL
jgi:chitin disaccharide deacetylase